jgi:F0F1-type ATP synthase membrane subunit b/b'
VSPAKRLLLISFAAYGAVAAAGLIFFKSPDLSKSYLARFGSDHERFVDITNDPGFQLFRERPHLYPAEDARHEQQAFVRAYQTRPEYRAERLRIEAFTLYFHVLNGVVFLVLAVGFSYRPVLNYLDKRVLDIKTQMAETSKARTAAMHRLAEVEAEADQWTQKEAGIKARADEAINASLVQIGEEARLARIQLARETEDRKRAELFRADALIKRELVSEAIETIEARYAAETSERDLRDKVDEFVRLLDLIA